MSQTAERSAVARSAETTLAAGTARFAVSYSGSVPYAGAGVVNLGDETAVVNRGDIYLEGSLFHPIPRREAEILGIADKHWVKTRTSAGFQLVFDPFLEGTRTVFEVLRQAEHVQTLRSGMERGIHVQRYAARVPLEVLLAALSPFVKETPPRGRPIDDPGPTSWRDYLVNYVGADEAGQHVNVAVDSMGRIRSVRLDLAEPVRVELYEYGVRVDATAPSPSEVISSSAYEQLKTDYCGEPTRQTLPRPYPCR
jgi:hypothetical protein